LVAAASASSNGSGYTGRRRGAEGEKKIRRRLEEG